MSGVFVAGKGIKNLVCELEPWHRIDTVAFGSSAISNRFSRPFMKMSEKILVR